MGIFRAYDIRGIYNEDITNDIADKIGKAYITHMNLDEAVVGQDSRMSSPFLSKSLIEGMTSAGADVYNLGLVPVPLIHFYLAMNKKRAGAYVSASHNPPEYNGFKLMDGVQSLSADGLQDIRKIIEGKHYRVGNGSVYKRDTIEKYTEFVENNVAPEKLKLVIDSANGTCGLVAPNIFKNLGCYVTELCSVPDGRFPNHSPDPTKSESLVEIKQRVVEFEADFGVAYDGDGDRVVFIDENGREVTGDQAFMLFARQILEKTKGKIICTVNSSRAVEEDIKAHGGTPIVSRVGHSFIKKRLCDEDALFAGEISGHYYFKDSYFGYDDAIYASLRMAEIVSQHKLSELVAALPKYYSSSEKRISCSEKNKLPIIEGLKKEFSDHKLITIDGIRVEFENGWALVRASNTEPVLSVRFEADTEQNLNSITKTVTAALNKQGVG